jgi:hypothetical protein
MGSNKTKTFLGYSRIDAELLASEVELYSSPRDGSLFLFFYVVFRMTLVGDVAPCPSNYGTGRHPMAHAGR